MAGWQHEIRVDRGAPETSDGEDCDGNVEASFTKDQLLENIMLYRVNRDHQLRDAPPSAQTSIRFSRSAFITTLNDDSAIAAAAMIGESRNPVNG